MDNLAHLWRTESSAHTVPRTGLVLPSCVPRFGVVSHRGCRQFRVTAFTRRSDRPRDVAEQWTVMWRSWLLLGTTAPNLWGEPWTTLRTGCGRSLCPHPVEIVRPRIHTPLSCTDVQPPGSLWTQLGTTSQSPACGRKKVGKSVEGGRNSTGNRTQGCWWDTGIGGRRRGWAGLGGVAEGRAARIRGPRRSRGAPGAGPAGPRADHLGLGRPACVAACIAWRSVCPAAAGDRPAGRSGGALGSSPSRPARATAGPPAPYRNPRSRGRLPRERGKAPRRPPGAPSRPYAAGLSRS